MPVTDREVEELLRPTPEEQPYEDDVQRNPYDIKVWLRYLTFQAEAPFGIRQRIFERAIKALPGSYKLWHSYLLEYRRHSRGFSFTDPQQQQLVHAFERALVTLGRMPRLWLEYTEYLVNLRKITATRKAFDRALRALPISQHDRIWAQYIKFIQGPVMPVITALSVWRRFLRVEPQRGEDYVEYLISVSQWDEAAKWIVNLVNDEGFSSVKGKTKHEYWLQLCDIISKHSEHIKSLNVDRILRTGQKRFSTDVGKLWTTLADSYIRLGQFEKARDVFEEGMNTVITVKDFSTIWDAYAQFEDAYIAQQIQEVESGGQKEQTEEELLDFDLRVARYEYLIERQPFLVNSVLLRQNPHNVHEWQKRATLYEERDDPVLVADTYTQALQTIDPAKARGKPHTLWVNFARYYAKNGDVPSARKIFEKATEATFKTIDDLATIWCEFAELELENGNYTRAREILQQATTPNRSQKLDKESVQRKVHRSSKLWSLYADLEENLGTFMTTKAVYDKMLENKAVTPNVIINYAHFLEEHKYYEESFKVYEKGLSMFKFPQSFDIWVAYLTKFVQRYGGRKLERARELFEQVCEECSAADAKVFYVMYANLEEEYGLARHAMSVYDRACRAVPEADRFAMYSLYIARATEFFGVAKTREIYEAAIEALPNNLALRMCVRYSTLEKKLGEIDRARAIFIHGAQISDPRQDSAFWKKWRQFEVEHGNQDTFREMLRIKRSVQAQLNTSVNIMTAEMMAAKTKDDEVALRALTQEVAEGAAAGREGSMSMMNDMALLEAQAQAFAQQKARGPNVGKAANPEEIKLGDEEEEEEGEESSEAEEGADKEGDEDGQKKKKGKKDEMQFEQAPLPETLFARNVRAGAVSGKRGKEEESDEERESAKKKQKGGQ